jgi:hypothetical protein
MDKDKDKGIGIWIKDKDIVVVALPPTPTPILYPPYMPPRRIGGSSHLNRKIGRGIAPLPPSVYPHIRPRPIGRPYTAS